ncbi:probable basic-leucine zipper transcription factor S isoform X2 [Macrosteles quadrilineatus]|uniref:probable basic-leucine zipper transcription factor S isoform X2 n=1 Tax=Macrosteles quadrilineatus TaxID=74068 RepID=UPI0023E10962|nr:probable basic-leucine zipper transcription factor S isoform X2 [Macrosteles quadrilineatus]
MERRRKAFRLKKTSATPEKNGTKSTRQSSTSGKSQPTGCVTPKHNTVVQPESPCSPLPSPGCMMMFPGTFRSPEIEVSWDWSCSQIPKEMLPPKKSKRKQDVKMQSPNLPNINMFHRPFPPQQKQITEEENQKRLEFYKNILGIKSVESSSDVLYDSTNNNLEEVSASDIQSCSTPKRPVTRLSLSSKKKIEDNLLLDDSANDLMIECSQAIEEKLKNGEIDMGPIVDIQISQSKRHHSPLIENSMSNKKSCLGRVNLFPESRNNEEIWPTSKEKNNSMLAENSSNRNDTKIHLFVESNKSVQSNSTSNKMKCDSSSSNKTLHNTSTGSTNISKNNVLNQNKINVKATEKQMNSSHQNLVQDNVSQYTSEFINNPTNKSGSTSSNFGCTKILHVNTSNQKDLDKICKPQNSNNYQRNEANFVKPPSSSALRSQPSVKQVNWPSHQMNEPQRPMLNSTLQDDKIDLQSLLDDDFDLELSNLDVDSLCRENESKSKQVTTSAPKLCTQQEIEAKRQAALQKLSMKKKR